VRKKTISSKKEAFSFQLSLLFGGEKKKRMIMKEKGGGNILLHRGRKGSSSPVPGA